VARAAPAGDEGLVVIYRRHLVPLAGAMVLVLGLLAVLAWRIWDTPDEGSLLEPMVVNATLSTPQHMFGDPIRGRVEVVLDANRVDPDSVKVRANFEPYRALRPPTQSRRAVGSVTRLSFDYQLACLTYRCLPRGQDRLDDFGGGQRRFRMKPGAVEYKTQGGSAQTEAIYWPTVTASGRVARNFWEAEMRGEFRELAPPSYRVSPRLVEGVALVLAVIFGAAATLLTLRQLPLARIAERLGLKTPDRRTPLARALARVHETSSPEQAPEGRRALERLAHELRQARNSELAWAASELAWSRQFPADGRLTVLSGEVERLISEGA
jgi:hypothetical protein